MNAERGLQATMGRLSDAVGRRRRAIVLAWAVAFVVSVPFSLAQTDHLTHGGYLAPGSQSSVVDGYLQGAYTLARPQEAVLIERDGASGSLDPAASQVRRLLASVPGVALPHVPAEIVTLLDRRNRQLIPLDVHGGWDARIDTATRIRRQLATQTRGQKGPSETLIGQDALWATLQSVQKQQLASAEQVGFPLTLLILLGIFGALAAAALPLALGAVGVTLTGAVIWLLSQQMTMTVFVTNAASMIGIGVAIDYSLFVLARYRRERAAAATPERARGQALRTSGLAVVFSGVTLILSLSGIFLVDSATLRSMALGMIVVVAFSILGAVTLTPASIALLGDRVCVRGRLVGGVRDLLAKLWPRRSSPGTERDWWSEWAARVQRRPGVAAAVACAVMAALALPALWMHIDNSAIGQLPRDDPATIATHSAERMVGAGQLAPLEEIVTFRDAHAGSHQSQTALAVYMAALQSHREVLEVAQVALPHHPAQALVTIVPRSGVEAKATYQLLQELREGSAGGEVPHAISSVEVGGDSALLYDFNGLVSRSMWKIALFVVIVGYLTLLVMLRSLLLPLKAILTTLLSVASAYGVLVTVFQLGALDGLLGYHSPGYVDSFAPPLLLVVTFGLSMDYELFLLAHIREARARGAEDADAVAAGLRATAATITGAALIMVAVFAIFATVGADAIKQIGFGEAVAIGLDATLVRLVLVPASMFLLGRWNWWLPARVERRLPELAYQSVR